MKKEKIKIERISYAGDWRVYFDGEKYANAHEENNNLYVYNFGTRFGVSFKDFIKLLLQQEKITLNQIQTNTTSTGNEIVTGIYIPFSNTEQIKKNKKITESKQVGTLYHFTSLSGATGILTSGKIKINEDGVISTTRDKNLNTSEFDTEGDPDENIVRIDLDGDKISNNYKIQPYSFGHMGKENLEFEEQIITGKEGLPIKYITNIKIMVNNEDEYSYKKHFNSLIQIIQEKNIPYEIK